MELSEKKKERCQPPPKKKFGNISSFYLFFFVVPNVEMSKKNGIMRKKSFGKRVVSAPKKICI